MNDDELFDLMDLDELFDLIDLREANLGRKLTMTEKYDLIAAFVRSLRA